MITVDESVSTKGVNTANLSSLAHTLNPWLAEAAEEVGLRAWA